MCVCVCVCVLCVSVYFIKHNRECLKQKVLWHTHNRFHWCCFFYTHFYHKSKLGFSTKGKFCITLNDTLNQ